MADDKVQPVPWVLAVATLCVCGPQQQDPRQQWAKRPHPSEVVTLPSPSPHLGEDSHMPCVAHPPPAPASRSASNR